MNLNFWNFRFTRLPFTVELGDTLDFATSPLRLQHLTLSALSLGDAGRLGIPVVHVSRCRTRWRSGKKLVTFCGLQFWSSHPMVQELKSLYLDLDLYLLVSFYHSISVSIYLSIYLPTYQSMAIKVLESLKDPPSLCHLWQVPSTSGGSDIPHLLFDLFALMHDLLFRLAWGRCWHNRTHHFHHFSLSIYWPNIPQFMADSYIIIIVVIIIIINDSNTDSYNHQHYHTHQAIKKESPRPSPPELVSGSLCSTWSTTWSLAPWWSVNLWHIGKIIKLRM